MTSPIANKIGRSHRYEPGEFDIFVRGDQFRNKFVLFARSLDELKPTAVRLGSAATDHPPRPLA
jgi:hypothetical protein